MKATVIEILVRVSCFITYVCFNFSTFVQDYRYIYKQPRNLNRLLTKAKFTNDNPKPDRPLPGIFRSCVDPRCQLCNQEYMQQCSSLKAANGKLSHVNSHITCNSKNVVYYLTCNKCNGNVTYVGITETPLRARTNNHISQCRLCRGSNTFDKHVFNCGPEISPPYFNVYVFMQVSAPERLLTYERHLHRNGYDTLNS